MLEQQVCFGLERLRRGGYLLPRTASLVFGDCGIYRDRAAKVAGNGRGLWWNVGASHRNHGVPTRMYRSLRRVSPLEEHRRLACAA
jgi:RNA-directed DNA polymerase